MESGLSNDIPKQMQQVRRELVGDVQALAENVQVLTDWRHYVKSHPWLCLGAAAVVGYVLVPKARSAQPLDAAAMKELLDAAKTHSSAPPKASSGIMSALVGMATSTLFQAGVGIISQHLNDFLAPPSGTPSETPNRSSETFH